MPISSACRSTASTKRAPCWSAPRHVRPRCAWHWARWPRSSSANWASPSSPTPWPSAEPNTLPTPCPHCRQQPMSRLWTPIRSAASTRTSRRRWSPRSTRRRRPGTPSAESSKSSPTTCPRGWAHMCIGIVVSTPAWPVPSWASRRSRASRSETDSSPRSVPDPGPMTNWKSDPTDSAARATVQAAPKAECRPAVRCVYVRE